MQNHAPLSSSIDWIYSSDVFDHGRYGIYSWTPYDDDDDDDSSDGLSEMIVYMYAYLSAYQT